MECFWIEPNNPSKRIYKNKDGIVNDNIVEAFADDIPFKNSFDFTSVVLIHIPNNRSSRNVLMNL